MLLNGVQEIPEEKLKEFGTNIANVVKENLIREPREPGLRMSAIGKPDRQLWFEINLPPEKKEPLRAEHYMKFMFGHLIEELLFFLSELAGHKVEGRQDELEIEGIKGHRDVVLDGVLLDAKSASSFSFKKFQEGLTPDKDSFGYLTQIQSYSYASKDDPLVVDKDRTGFLVLDKTLGHILLDIHPVDKTIDWPEIYKNKKQMVSLPEPPEEKCYPIKLDGYKNYKTGEFIPNGNELLDTECSYCPHKFSCYDNIRTFLSSTGPKYFTKVVKEPKMKEITNSEEKG